MGFSSRLEHHSDEIQALFYEGESIAKLAERFHIGIHGMSLFIKKKGFERKGVSHPAVKDMRETMLYKLAQCKDSKTGNYLVRCAGQEHKVFIDVSDYIELWERAEQIGQIDLQCER